MANQAVSAGHKITAHAAKTILENGGNAFDAAVAAAVSMFITEPCMSSAGAGGFAICHKAGAETSMLDFFVQTPIEKRPEAEISFYPIEVDFGNEKEIFYIGPGSMATPGILAGLAAMNERYGSMPMKEILEVPLQYAQKGVEIDPFQALDLTLLQDIFAQDASVREVFFKDGKTLQEKDTLFMPHLPDFINMIRYEGVEEFYKGELGKSIAATTYEKGGHLTRTDFESYNAIWRKPLKYNYHNYDVYAAASPSIGGAIFQLFLKIKDSKFNGDWIDTIAYIKNNYGNAEAIAHAMHKYLPHQEFTILGDGEASKGTSHFNVADKWGNAVSMTTSIGEGCGYFIPGTDMQMNNMLGEIFLLPDGMHSWKKNQRLNSKMTPIIACDHENDRFRFSAGTGGAGRIPYMLAQAMSYFLDDRLHLKDAINAPRVFVYEDMIQVENGFKQSLDNRKYPVKVWDEPSLFFGGVHAIGFSDEIEAYGDPRRYGFGITF